MLEQSALTDRIIGLAITVHRESGPGLLEAFYQTCLCQELEDAGIQYQTEAILPAIYKGRSIPMGYRADIVVADTIILEIKAVTAILPAHKAQLLTYLRMSHIKIGLLMNFHAKRLKDGLLRCVV